jgi:hypothetical protein
MVCYALESSLFSSGLKRPSCNDVLFHKVLAQTQQQARDILRQAQLAAEQQGAGIRRKYSIEAEKRLAQAETIKASAQEQPESQKLHAEGATRGTGPKEALKQDRAKPAHKDSRSSEHLDPKDPSSFIKRSPSVTDLPQNSSSKISEDFSSKQRPSKNDLVVGLELDGCAKAYPVQMAAGRKVINDTVAGEDVVVIFSPPSEPGIIFRRCVEGRSLTFAPLPEADNGLMLMKDQETGTTWEALTGRAISGALAPKELQRLTSEYSFWFAWSELHPDTEIYAEH